MHDTLADPDDVRAWLATHVYHPGPDDPDPGRVGLEIELFPFWTTRDGGPAARLALVEIVGIVDGVPGAERNPERSDGRPSWQLDGALITEEPGAQVEVAGPPEPDAGQAIAGAEAVIAKLRAAFADAGAVLAAAGLDCWSGPDDVPVQLSVPRYRAMTSYFQARGGSQGHLLMCASCSVQVNVDLGPPATAQQRWLLANLVSPVFVAAFAASPRPGAVNGRARGWQGLDPTRTGMPPPLLAGVDDPIEHALADALRADVLLVQRDNEAFPGRPGWSFADWLRQPHPRYGRPTTGDLATHLTTLFPEARLRGFLEIRGVDALPSPWRGAAVALVVGLLYDARASAAALDAVAGHRPHIPDLLARAAALGLADPLIADLATTVLEAAHDGARRLGIPQAADAAAFLERFTIRGGHPGDELATALAEGPAAALRWATW